MTESLEQYADRIVAGARRKLLDNLDDDVIGHLGESHLVFGKACAMEAISTAMHESVALPSPATDAGEVRERIAAIVDPGAFSGEGDYTWAARCGRRNKALTKAAAILALSPQAPSPRFADGIEAACVEFERAIADGYNNQIEKGAKCEHDKYFYEDCIACYDDFLAAKIAAIRRLGE